MTPHLEREVKLLARSDFELPDLSGVLPGANARMLPPRHLRALYWDTADLRLARAGVSLRRRAGEEGPARWTVKLPGAARRSMVSRREVNFDGNGSSVPSGAESLVRAYARRAPLSKVAELRSVRSRVELVGAAGEPLVEVDDDKVTVVEGPTAGSSFREVEVELHDGAAASVADAVAQRLLRAGAAESPPMAKISRALGGVEEAALTAAVSPEAAAGDLVRAALESGLARMVGHDPGVRIGEDPEEVHQMRVATRRLRSYLASMAPLVEHGWESHLRSELGWLALLLGRVRDADVLLQRLWGHSARLPVGDLEDVGALLSGLVSERSRDLDELWSAMDSDRYVSLLDSLVDGARTPALSERARRPASEAAVRMVRKPWKRLASQVDRLGPAPQDSALHRVRISAKRCRYAADVAELAIGKPAGRLSRSMARVQDCLGELHDCVVGEAWLRQAAADLRPAQALVAGELVVLERDAAEAARREWPPTWARASRRSLRRWMR